MRQFWFQENSCYFRNFSQQIYKICGILPLLISRSVDKTFGWKRRQKIKQYSFSLKSTFLILQQNWRTQAYLRTVYLTFFPIDHQNYDARNFDDSLWRNRLTYVLHIIGKLKDFFQLNVANFLRQTIAKLEFSVTIFVV